LDLKGLPVETEESSDELLISGRKTHATSTITATTPPTIYWLGLGFFACIRIIVRSFPAVST
jgi:hypothetical protein